MAPFISQAENATDLGQKRRYVERIGPSIKSLISKNGLAFASNVSN